MKAQWVRLYPIVSVARFAYNAPSFSKQRNALITTTKSITPYNVATLNVNQSRGDLTLSFMYHQKLPDQSLVPLMVNIGKKASAVIAMVATKYKNPTNPTRLRVLVKRFFSSYDFIIRLLSRAPNYACDCSLYNYSVFFNRCQYYPLDFLVKQEKFFRVFSAFFGSFRVK